MHSYRWKGRGTTMLTSNTRRHFIQNSAAWVEEKKASRPFENIGPYMDRIAATDCWTRMPERKTGLYDANIANTRCSLARWCFVVKSILAVLLSWGYPFFSIRTAIYLTFLVSLRDASHVKIFQWTNQCTLSRFRNTSVNLLAPSSAPQSPMDPMALVVVSRLSFSTSPMPPMRLSPS